jgi:hypothetical protein
MATGLHEILDVEAGYFPIPEDAVCSTIYEVRVEDGRVRNCVAKVLRNARKCNMKARRVDEFGPYETPGVDIFANGSNVLLFLVRAHPRKLGQYAVELFSGTYKPKPIDERDNPELA